MLRLASALLVVIACSSSEPTPAPAPAPSPTPTPTPAPAPKLTRPVAPWLVDFDPAAAESRFEAMRRSASLRCVLDLAVKERETAGILEDAADEAPPIILRALAVAMSEHPGIDQSSFESRALGAGALLKRGAMVDGRILLEASEARESLFYVEYRAALGMPYDAEGPRTLHTITELALAGAEAEAAKLYDVRIVPAALKPYELEHHVAALVALDRRDAAAKIVAAEPPDRQWLARRAWMPPALRKKTHVADAIEGLLAARTTRGVDWVQDSVVMSETIRFGRGLGLGAELAPLRLRLLDELTRVEHGLDTELALARLADEVLAHGDPDELRLLEPALARSDMNVWKRHVAATRALHHGTLPQALAAIGSIGMSSEIELYVRLWVRHAVAGLDSTFDAQFVASACPPDMERRR